MNGGEARQCMQVESRQKLHLLPRTGESAIWCDRGGRQRTTSSSGCGLVLADFCTGACEHLQHAASHGGEEDVIRMQRSLELAMSTMIRCRRTEPGGYDPSLFGFFSDLESMDLLSIAKPLSVSALSKHMKRVTLMTNISYKEAHHGVVRWACLSDFLVKGEGPHP
jgi:hypothetical protein